ncbi:MAG: GNAT family N-acetyltransferase [Saccharospirillaceae bacterium]|nr:GNAT family N-acetyltransferase [Pseudomonadales bacterium]NRB79885.1 GNAT family N-acetyltransferase [Saccharospirillaceae bacterium]
MLRAITLDDVQAIFDIFSRDEVTGSYDCYSFTENSQALDWVKNNIANYAKAGEKGFRWAITLIEAPDQLIGSCGFHCVNKNFKSFEIGYELHPDFWGKGYATQAVAAMIDYSFISFNIF